MGSFFSNYTTNERKTQEKIQKTLDSIHERMDYKTEILPFMQQHMTEKTFQRFVMCGMFLFFDTDGHIANANFCKHRMCPVCNNRRALKKYAENRAIIDFLGDDFRYLFFTATVKNCTADTLIQTINCLNEGFHRFANTSKFREVSQGYFKSLEITYNAEKNTYHPHFHWILAVRPKYFTEQYTSTFEWRKMWERSLRLDYNCQFDVKAIKGEEQSNAIAEISKYSIKLSSVLETKDEAQRATAIDTILKAIHNRRLINTAGVFRYACKALNIDPNSDEVTDRQFDEIVYFYDSGKYRKSTAEELTQFLYGQQS